MSKPKGSPVEKAAKERSMEASAWTAKSENKDYLACHMELWSFPKTDLYNPTEIENTIKAYLQVIHKYAMRPSLESLAVALHTTSQTLYGIRTGASHRNVRTMEILTDFRQICESCLREGMLDAKNPAGFIFCLKARHGWIETNRIQIEQRDATVVNGEETMKALEQKYLDSVVLDVNGKEVEIAKPEEIVVEAEEIKES